jgi:hypothetical protein
MYSQAAWGGATEPFILTKFDNSSFKGDADAIVSFVIFEWRDEKLLGAQPNPTNDVRASWMRASRTTRFG